MEWRPVTYSRYGEKDAREHSMLRQELGQRGDPISGFIPDGEEGNAHMLQTKIDAYEAQYLALKRHEEVSSELMAETNSRSNMKLRVLQGCYSPVPSSNEFFFNDPRSPKQEEHEMRMDTAYSRLLTIQACGHESRFALKQKLDEMNQANSELSSDLDTFHQVFTADKKSRTPLVQQPPAAAPVAVLQQKPDTPVQDLIDQLYECPKDRVPIVWLCTAAFCPMNKDYLKRLAEGKASLEASEPVKVVGAYLSPSHDVYISGANGKIGYEINSEERADIIDQASAGIPWIAADRWEGRRRGPVHRHDLLERLQDQVRKSAEPLLLRVPQVFMCVDGAKASLNTKASTVVLPTQPAFAGGPVYTSATKWT